MASERFSSVRERLPAFLAGASAGLLAAWIVSRSRAGPRAPASATPSFPAAAGEARPQTRWAETLDDALETLASARERFLGPPLEIDLEELRGRLAELPGADELQVRDLGEGIVEVLGHAQDQDAVQRVLDALAAAPGVNVVVNRVWTPSSLAPADPVHGPTDAG